jgi:hypothetical protein
MGFLTILLLAFALASTAQCDVTLPALCANEPCVPVSGGSGVGTYLINGVPITQLCPSDNGQTITFTSSGSGCPGTATAVFNVNPVPVIGVTFN